MKTADCSKNKTMIKILIPFVLFWSMIIIVEAGHSFGQWLHGVLN